MGKLVENLTPDKPANANDVRASARNAKAMRTQMRAQCAHGEGVVTTPNIHAMRTQMRITCAQVRMTCAQVRAMRAQMRTQCGQALATRMKKRKDTGTPPPPKNRNMLVKVRGCNNPQHERNASAMRAQVRMACAQMRAIRTQMRTHERIVRSCNNPQHARNY